MIMNSYHFIFCSYMCNGDHSTSLHNLLSYHSSFSLACLSSFHFLYSSSLSPSSPPPLPLFCPSFTLLLFFHCYFLLFPLSFFHSLPSMILFYGTEETYQGCTKVHPYVPSDHPFAPYCSCHGVLHHLVLSTQSPKLCPGTLSTYNTYGATTNILGNSQP